MAEEKRPIGEIVIHDDRGYAYIPKIVRNEIGLEGKGKIPFYVDANVVLLVRENATKEDIVKGLDILKQDLQLRWKTNRNEQSNRKTPSSTSGSVRRPTPYSSRGRSAKISFRLPVGVYVLLRKSVSNVSGFVRKVVVEGLERLPVWFEVEEFRLEVEAAQLINELQVLHRYQKNVLKHGSYAEAYLKQLKGGLVVDRKPFHVREPRPDVKPEEKELVEKIVVLREDLAKQLMQKLNRLVELKKSHVNSQKGGDRQK